MSGWERNQRLFLSYLITLHSHHNCGRGNSFGNNANTNILNSFTFLRLFFNFDFVSENVKDEQQSDCDI